MSPALRLSFGPEVARRRAALDDDLALGHRRRRGLVRGQLGRLELLEVAPAPARPALRAAAGPACRHARLRAARPPARRAPERPPKPPPEGRPPKPPPPGGPPGPPLGAQPRRDGRRSGAGTAATGCGTRTVRTCRPAPAHARRGRDGPAARAERWPRPRRRRDGPARGAERRAGRRAGDRAAGGCRGVSGAWAAGAWRGRAAAAGGPRCARAGRLRRCGGCRRRRCRAAAADQRGARRRRRLGFGAAPAQRRGGRGAAATPGAPGPS